MDVFFLRIITYPLAALVAIFFSQYWLFWWLGGPPSVPGWDH